MGRGDAPRIFQMKHDTLFDEYGSLRVVCIYEAFHCRVCDRKTPHVELTHCTANNVDLKETPWDTHRLEKGMMCLSHSDIDLPKKTLVDRSFLHRKTGVYVRVQLDWKQQGRLTAPAQDGYRACTERYTIGFDFSKGTKQGEMLGGGYGDYGIEDIICDLPLNNQKALDALIIGIAIQQTEKGFSYLIPKDEPQQLEMFA